MRRWLQIVLIAIFLTASFRLVPLALGDTARIGVFGLLAFLTCGRRSLDFATALWPLFAIMGLTLAVDLIFNRVGYFTLIVWVQFLAAVMVASATYALDTNDLKRVIWLSIALLIGQYAMIIFEKEYFISMAERIGIRDPFVTYGSDLERVYYAYFHANTAAYSIYYMLLSFVALDRIQPFDRLWRWTGLAILAILIFLTGGRGVLLLLASLTVALMFAGRSSRIVVVVLGLTVGWAVALPLYNSVTEVILLREESNFERLTAFWQYIELIKESPVFGQGSEVLMSRESYGLRASHNFFVETLARFGIILGGALIAYLILKLVIEPKKLVFTTLGLFSLLPGLLNNTLLTTWAFIPLIIPLLIQCGEKGMSQGRLSFRRLRGAQSYRAGHPIRI